MSDSPFEIIAGPFDVYIAVLATAFPAIDAAPAGAWKKLGAGGSKNYSEEGVLVRNAQALEFFRALGTTGPRKAFRTEEDVVVEFMLHDATIESYGQILNDAAVTDTAPGAGVAGHREIKLLQGRTVKRWAMLIRGQGIAPYDDSALATKWNSQWEIPIVVQEGNPESVYTKGQPVGLKCAFRALEHDADGFGKLRMQDAAPV